MKYKPEAFEYWGDTLPKKIRMVKTVRADVPWVKAVAYMGEQDALCTRLANARHEAARLGYCAGHSDTVEGTYADPAEVAADICQEMDDDERMGENA